MGVLFSPLSRCYLLVHMSRTNVGARQMYARKKKKNKVLRWSVSSIGLRSSCKQVVQWLLQHHSYNGLACTFIASTCWGENSTPTQAHPWLLGLRRVWMWLTLTAHHHHFLRSQVADGSWGNVNQALGRMTGSQKKKKKKNMQVAHSNMRKHCGKIPLWTLQNQRQNYINGPSPII